MKITFLGTGTSQGVPPIGCQSEVCFSKDPKDQRLRSSALVNIKNKNFLIDCGPDFRQQMLAANSPKIDAILLTHEHYDHIGGLEDIRPLNHLYKKSIPVYGVDRVLEQIRRRYFYAFEEPPYVGSFKAELKEIREGEKSIRIENIAVQPIKVKHGKLDILAYRFGDLAYITDASYISPEEINRLKNLDILVINSLRIEAHPAHFHLEKAIEICKLLKPKRCYLTHISHKLGKHEEVEKKLPRNIHLAFDRLSISNS